MELIDGEERYDDAWKEAELILAAKTILDRNVERSGVTSRRDNNYLFDVVLELECIAERIKNSYNNS